MTHIRRIFFFLIFTSLILPLAASAHERELINIAGTDYLFVVGSLGEPVVVDDKSGVDLRVSIPDPKDPTDSSLPGVRPVTGLEQTLQVEISTGAQKKVFALSPAWKDKGAYSAIFFPTVDEVFTYRFFGTINAIPVDLSFSCLPEGTQASEEKNEVPLGEGVVRKFKTGGFGCPLSKSAFAFPETKNSDNTVNAPGTHNDTALTFALVAFVFALIALGQSRKCKKHNG